MGVVCTAVASALSIKNRSEDTHKRSFLYGGEFHTEEIFFTVSFCKCHVCAKIHLFSTLFLVLNSSKRGEDGLLSADDLDIS